MPVSSWRSLEPVEVDPAAPSNGRPLHQEAHLSAEAKGLSRTRLLTRHISTSRKYPVRRKMGPGHGQAKCRTQ